MSAKGKTRWFPRRVHPVRPGVYECIARPAGFPRAIFMNLEWDGVGFLVSFPVEVHRWRGQTRSAYLAQLKEKNGEAN